MRSPGAVTRRSPTTGPSPSSRRSGTTSTVRRPLPSSTTGRSARPRPFRSRPRTITSRSSTSSRSEARASRRATRSRGSTSAPYRCSRSGSGSREEPAGGRTSQEPSGFRRRMNADDPLRLAAPFDDSPSAGTIHRLDRIEGFDRALFARLPLTLRIIAENWARRFDPKLSDAKDLTAFVRGDRRSADLEIPFYPGRVLLQDFTGVPVIVDLTALRTAAVATGLPPSRINPGVPVDLIVDHSVQVDSFGSSRSITLNLDREYERNSERYGLLRWAQRAYDNVRVVPPGNGICHQVNLEYLATVVTRRKEGASWSVFPDTLVGTDSHTTMVNGLGVLAW